MEAGEEEADVERKRCRKGENCKQLFAMVVLSLHFNLAFPGTPAVPSQGCALSGDLCLRTEHLLFAAGLFIIAVLRLKPRA